MSAQTTMIKTATMKAQGEPTPFDVLWANLRKKSCVRVTMGPPFLSASLVYVDLHSPLAIVKEAGSVTPASTIR